MAPRCEDVLERVLDRVGHLVVNWTRSRSRARRWQGYLLASAAFCALLPLVLLFVVIPRRQVP